MDERVPGTVWQESRSRRVPCQFSPKAMSVSKPNRIEAKVEAKLQKVEANTGLDSFVRKQNVNWNHEGFQAVP